MTELALSFDIETNGFKPNVVHCLALQCIHSKAEILCADQPGYLPIRAGLALLREADWVIAHNGLDFDVPVLEQLYPGFAIDRSKVIDTLLLARRMFSPTSLMPSDRLIEGMPSDLRGKHALKAWGYRVEVLKGEFSNEKTDWTHFTHEMASYCMNDVRVTTALHELLMLAAMQDVAEAA